MLSAIEDPGPLISQLAPDIAHSFTIRHFLASANPHRLLHLANDSASAPVLLVMVGAELMVLGELAGINAAMTDLLTGRVAGLASWPTAEIEVDWQEYGKRHLFFNSSTLQSWRAARLAGFCRGASGHDDYVAYQWHWQGLPRFGELVKHSCRVASGLELLELVKRGVWYGNEGDYVEKCLLNGPSFVCELQEDELDSLLSADSRLSVEERRVKLDAALDVAHGDSAQANQLRPGWVAVCWACTHLNGTMGMIYTPPQFRRFGFARSLAAFQIDAMLKHEGFAACHIVDNNVPSMQLAASLGGTVLHEPVVWRTLYWPGEIQQAAELAPV